MRSVSIVTWYILPYDKIFEGLFSTHELNLFTQPYPTTSTIISHRPYDERCAITHAHAHTRLNSPGCAIDCTCSSSFSPLVKCLFFYVQTEEKKRNENKSSLIRKRLKYDNFSFALKSFLFIFYFFLYLFLISEAQISAVPVPILKVIISLSNRDR